MDMEDSASYDVYVLTVSPVDHTFKSPIVSSESILTGDTLPSALQPFYPNEEIQIS